MRQNELFENIYHCHFRRLYEMAFRVLHDKDDALDTVHDVMLGLHAHLDEMKNDPASYLSASLRNRLADRLRKMDLEERHARWIAEDNDEAIDAGFGEEADRQKYIFLINRVVESELSPAVKRVFDAVFRHGRSYADVASDLSISVSTVNKHVVTALKILRQYFKDNQI